MSAAAEGGAKMFEQVQSQKYYLQIVNQIRTLIAEGKLKEGERLPAERVLAQQFGTSRASIREALSALEILGLVEAKSGQGNFIRSEGLSSTLEGESLTELLREHSPYEIFESRLEIEPSLAGLAAQRASAGEREELLGILETLNRIGRELEADPARVDDYMEEDRKLHLKIGQCAHNSVLHMVFAAVNQMMTERHWRVLKSKGVFQEGNIRKYEREHNSIVRAICEGRAEAARKEMRRHIFDVKKDLFEE